MTKTAVPTRAIHALLIFSVSVAFQCFAHAAIAAPVGDFGLDWVTVGDPGNRAMNPSERAAFDRRTAGRQADPVGRVDYPYRIMRSPLTCGQYIEFLDAFHQHYGGSPTSGFLTGPSILGSSRSDGTVAYETISAPDDAAVNVHLFMAAFFTNWINNGRGSDRSDFYTGVYDMTGFDASNVLAWQGPGARNPDAKVWIQSIDEAFKAAFWDPNKDGGGGYWQFPNSSDSPLVVGLPEDGGETIGQTPTDPVTAQGEWPIGRFPATRSPWGMLDYSGTRRTWTDTAFLDKFLVVGSESGDPAPEVNDVLGETIWHYSYGQSDGIRLAGVVPGPASLGLALAFLGLNTVVRRRSNRRAIGAAFLGAAVASHAAAAEDYGLDWVTVGDPCNRAMNASEQAAFDTWTGGTYTDPVGRVDYEYRTMRSPVTYAQYIEFLDAFHPHFDGKPYDPFLTGPSILGFDQPDGTIEYKPISAPDDAAVDMKLYMAAFYANWINSGKGQDRADFYSGVYDMSSFDINDTLSWFTPGPRNPEAKVWIQSIDEAIKAAYWDPNKDGSGGYWMYPNGSDAPLVVGLPEEGGETVGNRAGELGYFRGEWPVGQYPGTQSPWGLLDFSGTRRTWTDTPIWDKFFILGSESGDRSPASEDALGEVWMDYSYALTYGVRLAAVVPAPASLGLALASLGLTIVGRRRSSRRAIGAAFLCAAVSAHAGAAEDHDLDWVMVGDPGNIAYDGGEYGVHAGRGSVAYEYRIARTELTTAQYLDYINRFSDLSDEMNLLLRPSRWGAGFDGSYNGPGDRYTLLGFHDRMAEVPVNLSWRQAAMFANWLHNGKTDDPDSLLSGAYDVSTFGEDANGSLTDQARRSPGAKFWIPDLDEYMKAASYDPNKNGPGQPGWWKYRHSSDELPVTGFPGEGDTLIGMSSPDIEAALGMKAIQLPVGLFPEVQSPWGLLDMVGSRAEWLEGWAPITGAGGPRSRFFNGSEQTSFLLDFAEYTWFFGEVGPANSSISIRFASAIPAPLTLSVLVGGLGVAQRARSMSGA